MAIEEVRMDTEEEVTYMRHIFIALDGFLDNVVVGGTSRQDLIDAIQAYIDALTALDT